MSTSRFTRFLKSLLAGATVIPPAASFLESSAISKPPQALSVVATQQTQQQQTQTQGGLIRKQPLSGNGNANGGGGGVLVRGPSPSNNSSLLLLTNSNSGTTRDGASGASSIYGGTTPHESPPSPLSVAAAALASTEGGHANSFSSRSMVVSNVSYPANDPLEDRFDFKEFSGGLAVTPASSSSSSSAGHVYSPTLLAAVLDGHGGWQVADFARRTLLSAIETELENCPSSSLTTSGNNNDNDNSNNLDEDGGSKFATTSWHVGSALARAFARIDRSFLSAVKPAFELGFGSVAHVGACALAAAVTRDSIVIANAGDCRAVLGRVHFGPTAPPTAIGAPVFFFSPLSLSGDLASSSSSSSFNSSSEDNSINFFDQSSSSSRQWAGKNTLDVMKKTILSDIGTVWHQASPSSSSSSFTLPTQSSLSSSDLALPQTSSSSSSSSSLSPTFFYSAVSLSHDHNAREPREKARLAAAHPGEDDVVVCKPGNASACYVKGRLQPTRSLGDGYLKDSEFNVPARIGRMWGRHIKAPYTPPYVSSHAELSSIPIQPRGADSSSFLILACDGVWDELSSEEAVAVVADHVQSAGGPHRATPRDLEGAAEKIKEAVLQRAAEAEGMSVEQLRQMRPGKEGRRGYHDDITALVVFFGAEYTKPFPSSSNNNPYANPLFPGMTTLESSTSSSLPPSKWWPF